MCAEKSYSASEVPSCALQPLSTSSLLLPFSCPTFMTAGLGQDDSWKGVSLAGFSSGIVLQRASYLKATEFTILRRADDWDNVRTRKEMS